jgi:hypothetical protein
MSKMSKALIEVWEWKEKIYEERKDMTLAEWAERSRESGSKLRREYGIGGPRDTAAKAKKAVNC